MLDCVAWDCEVMDVPTAFALTFDERNKCTVVVSVSQSGSPGQIISVEAEPQGELDIKVVLGDRDSEVAMLLARRLHAEVFKNMGEADSLLKLMLLLSLKEKEDTSIIPAIIEQVSRQIK
jgi:Proteasome assembly chaperone 3